jgi:hypothetical protein
LDTLFDAGTPIQGVSRLRTLNLTADNSASIAGQLTAHLVFNPPVLFAGCRQQSRGTEAIFLTAMAMLRITFLVVA